MHHNRRCMTCSGDNTQCTTRARAHTHSGITHTRAHACTHAHAHAQKQRPRPKRRDGEMKRQRQRAQGWGWGGGIGAEAHTPHAYAHTRTHTHVRMCAHGIRYNYHWLIEGSPDDYSLHTAVQWLNTLGYTTAFSARQGRNLLKGKQNAAGTKASCSARPVQSGLTAHAGARSSL